MRHAAAARAIVRVLDRVTLEFAEGETHPTAVAVRAKAAEAAVWLARQIAADAAGATDLHDVFVGTARCAAATAEKMLDVAYLTEDYNLAVENGDPQWVAEAWGRLQTAEMTPANARVAPFEARP